MATPINILNELKIQATIDELVLPPRDLIPNPNTQTNPNELRSWVNDMPIANPPAVASMTLKSISLLNRHPEAVPRRDQLLRCYFPAMQQLLHFVRDDAEHPDRPRDEQMANSLREAVEKIVSEMALGYKLVAAEESSSIFRKDAKQQQAENLYYAIKYLALEMVFSYAAYRKAPEYSLPEILHLFALAHAMNLAEEPVVDRTNTSNLNTNIASVVSMILLLILLDPFHLRPGEIWQAYSYLVYRSSRATLNFGEKRETAKGLFIVDQEGAGKPAPYDGQSTGTESAEHLFLNASQLNTRVNKHLKLLKNGQKSDLEEIRGLDASNPISARQMLQHMLLAWHIVPKRRHTREERQAQLTAVCGVASIHLMLSGGTPKPGGVGMDILLWKQRNISAGGVEVSAPLADQKYLQVGELVLLQGERGGDLTMKLGVVRHLFQVESDTLCAGIQFIYGRVFPVTIQPSGQSKNLKLHTHPSLMVERGDNYPGNLFTPRHVFRQKRDYTVKSDTGTNLSVHSGNLLEASKNFERFEFSRS